MRASDHGGDLVTRECYGGRARSGVGDGEGARTRGGESGSEFSFILCLSNSTDSHKRARYIS